MKITKITAQALLATAAMLASDDFYQIADVLRFHDDDSIALDSLAFLPVVTACFTDGARALKIKRFSLNRTQENLAYGLLSGGNSAAEKVLKILKLQNFLSEATYKMLINATQGKCKLQILADLHAHLSNALRANDVCFIDGYLAAFIKQLIDIPNNQLSQFLDAFIVLSKCRGFLQAKDNLAQMGHIDNPLWDAKQFPLCAADITALITCYAGPEGAALALTKCIKGADDAGFNFSSLVMLIGNLAHGGVAEKLSLVNSIYDTFASDASGKFLRSTFKLLLRHIDKLSLYTLKQLQEVSPHGAGAQKIIHEIVVNGKSYDASIAKLGFFGQGIELSELGSGIAPKAS